MYSKEQKQVLSEAMVKESQSKQGSTTSMRTRTKVKFEVLPSVVFSFLSEPSDEQDFL
jgi:hypothetical protein